MDEEAGQRGSVRDHTVRVEKRRSDEDRIIMMLIYD